MPLRSRISPKTVANSRVSPHPGRVTTHIHRFCISLLNLHNGRTPGHSSRSPSLFVFLLHSIHVLLSTAFVYFPYPLLQLSSSYHPQARSHARPILHNLFFQPSPSPLLLLSIFLLSRYLTYTCDVFSRVTPSFETYCAFKFVVSRTLLRFLFLFGFCDVCDILLNLSLLSMRF